MKGSTGRTTIAFRTQRWHLIDNYERLLKLWTKAIRKGTFFEVRYAGRRFLVNPGQVVWMANHWTET